MREIPLDIWEKGIADVCEKHYKDPDIEDRINAVLPLNWKFESFYITDFYMVDKDKDFGPIFAKLTLSFDGEFYEGTIMVKDWPQ